MFMHITPVFTMDALINELSISAKGELQTLCCMVGLTEYLV